MFGICIFIFFFFFCKNKNKHICVSMWIKFLLSWIPKKSKCPTRSRARTKALTILKWRVINAMCTDWVIFVQTLRHKVRRLLSGHLTHWSRPESQKQSVSPQLLYVHHMQQAAVHRWRALHPGRVEIRLQRGLPEQQQRQRRKPALQYECIDFVFNDYSLKNTVHAAKLKN